MCGIEVVWSWACTSISLWISGYGGNRSDVIRFAPSPPAIAAPCWGGGWAILAPLLILAVYTFIFTVVFRSSWGEGELGPWGAVLNLFAGLITFNRFAEVVNEAPILVAARRNFVAKVVFPLQILSVVSVLTALFRAIINVMILLTFQLLIVRSLSFSLLWLPMVWLPLLMIALALSWLMSSLGVFLRDLPQVTSLLAMLLVFMSAVFYPLSPLPISMRLAFSLNPIAELVHQTRLVLIQAEQPNPTYLLIALVLSFVAAEAAIRFFERIRHSVASVI